MSRTVVIGALGLALVLGSSLPAQALAPQTLSPLALGGASSEDTSTIGVLGSRPGATRLPLRITDQVDASVDVGTGNLMVSVSALSLPGTSADVSLGVVYNSRSTDMNGAGVAPRWSMALGAARSLTATDTGVLYTAGDGYSALFSPVPGSTTAFTAPAGVKADLIKTPAGYTLTSRTSAAMIIFNAAGQTVSFADRNGNTSTIGYNTAGTKPVTVVSTRGSAGARTAVIGYDDYAGQLSGFSQSSGSASRSAGLRVSHDLAGFTDPAGNTTTFAYSYSMLTSITSPTGASTRFSYDSAGRVTTITRVNTGSGSPGDSVTRFTYPSSTQTLVAGPNTDVNVAVAAGPHTSYTLTADGRVAGVRDPMGRVRSATYTADFDILTATAGIGAAAGTTTNTYGANTGQSITASRGAGGATGQAAYTNTAAATKYLASSTIDGAGNESLFTYNGAGNMMSSTDATGAAAALTRNSDGTVATALAPGNGTNTTGYRYDSNHQLVEVSPVTGSSLGTRTFSYDVWGRTKTATDGAGTTVTYSYDPAGRVMSTAFSDATAAVSFSYDGNGQVLTRTDGSGTTTYGYDRLGRLVSRANTAGGGTISYGYDRASNLVSTTDSRGTTTYAFDASGVPTSMTYGYGGGSHVLAFATDERGRRTDTWMDTNPAHTTWAAHSHTDYDSTGRVARATARVGTGDADNRPVMDLTYCHAAGTTPTASGACPATASADRSNIQWVADNLTGALTSYDYDGADRLTKATVTGGSAPITYTYSYDARGNRLTASTTGAMTTSQSLAVNAANQISSTGYTYDGTGNLIQDPDGTYTYNGAAQLTKVTKAGTTYRYTYAGSSQAEVLSEATPVGYYNYTYGRTDAQGLPVIEQVHRDNATAYIEHDPVTGQPLMLRTSGEMESLYVNDGTGNPAALITSGNYITLATSYDPYGVATITKDAGGYAGVENPYTFKNGLQDHTTGWIKYGTRYYNPATGRWTQQDTLDDPLNPANANRYTYAANNPINNTDPTGRWYLNATAIACFFTCGGVGIGIDKNGLNVGFTAGVGPRIEAGANIGGGIGSLQGVSNSIECSGKILGGATVGVGISPPDLYAGVGPGVGGGCSIQHAC